MSIQVIQAKDVLRLIGENDDIQEFINIASHVKVNECDFHGLTLLHHAVSTPRCNKMCIKWVLDRGEDVNFMSSSGDTPLHMAVYYGHFDFIKMLLDEGVDINSINDKGETPLNLSALFQRREIFNLLVESGADVEKVSMTDMAICGY